MSAGAGRRPVLLPGVGLSADELAQIAQLTHSQRYEMNKALDAQGALLQGTAGSTTRSKAPPVVQPLEKQFALSDTAPSGVVYVCAGRPSAAAAGCPTSTSWPPEQDQRYQNVFPLNYRVILCIGYVPVLGLEDGWEAVHVSVQCSAIRERLLLLQEIELLEQHMQEQAQAA